MAVVDVATGAAIVVDSDAVIGEEGVTILGDIVIGILGITPGGLGVIIL